MGVANLVHELKSVGEYEAADVMESMGEEITRLRKIEAAAKNLISAKGGYYSQEYGELEELLK